MPKKLPLEELRQVSPIIAKVRDILIQRKFTNPLRYKDFYADRTQPPPSLPDGPHHKLSANYYYTHDARREVQPPQLIATYQKQIAASHAKDAATLSPVSRTPGNSYQWD